MNRLVKYVSYCMIFSFSLFTACAAILTDRYQDVTFKSEPSDAKVTVVDENQNIVFVGFTPTTVGLNKRESHYSSYIYKEGYEESSERLGVKDAKVSEIYFLNAFLLGPFYFSGTNIDKASGAKYKIKYPETIDVTLTPGTGNQTVFYNPHSTLSTPYIKPLPPTSSSQSKLYMDAGGSGGADGGDGGTRVGRVIGDSNWIFAGVANVAKGEQMRYFGAASLIYYPIPQIQISAAAGAGYIADVKDSFMGALNAILAWDFGEKNDMLIGFQYQGGFYGDSSFSTYGPYIGYKFKNPKATNGR